MPEQKPGENFDREAGESECMELRRLPLGTRRKLARVEAVHELDGIRIEVIDETNEAVILNERCSPATPCPVCLKTMLTVTYHLRVDISSPATH